MNIELCNRRPNMEDAAPFFKSMVITTEAILDLKFVRLVI